MPFVGSLNRAVIIGNIANDPILTYTQQTNTPVCKFTIATNRKFKTQSGETREEASFHRIVVWGNRAENLSKILTKGTKVYVEGRIVYNQRQLENGKTCKEASIRALDIIILSRKKPSYGSAQNTTANDQTATDASDAILDLDSLAQELTAETEDVQEDNDVANEVTVNNADTSEEDKSNTEDDLPF